MTKISVYKCKIDTTREPPLFYLLLFRYLFTKKIFKIKKYAESHGIMIFGFQTRTNVCFIVILISYVRRKEYMNFIITGGFFFVTRFVTRSALLCISSIFLITLFLPFVLANKEESVVRYEITLPVFRNCSFVVQQNSRRQEARLAFNRRQKQRKYR